ncbi:gastrula zinc finger protein XlCGF32.1 [Daphnia magna]|uniref:C2H2-type domain-containing protein n=1 Tax=Daphnia magna TaxID=35525 RepID=A0ABR0A6P5_9CRUS|nr:gastrula zinc finger protein XlCGF32.1 [Daphnia magna]KAK4020812.1 hypothetical protein OUZ56_002757 [Daphnia magna]
MGNDGKIEMFECPMFNCERFFVSLSLLKRHMLYHAGICPYMCVKCGTSFKLEYALNSHLRFQHDEQMDDKFKRIRGFVSCNICSAMVPCREKKAHIATHLPY